MMRGLLAGLRGPRAAAGTRPTDLMSVCTNPPPPPEQQEEEEGDGRARPGGRRRRRKGGNSLPDRWKDYLPLGRRMPGTRFIAFKVPLEKNFDKKLAPAERFSLSDLVSQIRAQKEELGLIIDLTYTQRYYKPKDLPDTLLYMKIFTVGHHVPDNNTIFKFKCAVNQFLEENKDNDKLIGVHCTHGLNRTGYLVCRYLIDVEGMEPNAAIELFNSCRGHSIERKNYIRDLQDGPIRNNDGPEDSRPGHFGQSQWPNRPVWNSNHQGPHHNSPGPRGFPAEPRDFPAPPRDLYHQSWDLYSRPWNLNCQPPGFHPTTRTGQRHLKSLGPTPRGATIRPLPRARPGTTVARPDTFGLEGRAARTPGRQTGRSTARDPVRGRRGTTASGTRSGGQPGRGSAGAGPAEPTRTSAAGRRGAGTTD
ncbi:RNA/RNP complex-1-interacting phosphatase [Ornithorhynchus anatinus]|uniref:RNA/RNP complex-1-interacting phosphatase n=1 Tax=Ornithorhynchus anatinus TaxID=9258 RepID=A0A6I8N1S7_ORNAN|nr:RNA/RNP complex-1-interacting phosphatase [Ornithorhynchus anatinus]